MKRIVISFLLLVCVAGILYPNAGEPDFKLGMSYYKERKFLLSIGAFQKAIKNGYTSPEVYFYLGNSLKETQKFEQALESYRTAYELSDKNDFRATVLYNMGNTYYSDRNYTNAIKMFNDSYKLSKKQVGVFWLKGLAYYRLKDKQNTINEWEAYVTLTPNGPQSENIRKVLAILKADNFQFPPDQVATSGQNNNTTGKTVETLIDIEGVLNEVKPEDKGKAENTQLEDIEK